MFNVFNYFPKKNTLIFLEVNIFREFSGGDFFQKIWNFEKKKSFSWQSKSAIISLKKSLITFKIQNKFNYEKNQIKFTSS